MVANGTLAGACEGDHLLAALVVEEAAPRLQAFFQVRVHDFYAAEDLTQETLLGLLRSRYPSSVCADAWMFGIARHLYLGWRRRQVESPAVEQPTNLAVADRSDQVVVAAWLASAMVALSAADRQTLALRYGLDMSCGQVADVLGCSVGAIRVRLHRARRRLQAQLS